MVLLPCYSAATFGFCVDDLDFAASSFFAALFQFSKLKKGLLMAHVLSFADGSRFCSLLRSEVMSAIHY